MQLPAVPPQSWDDLALNFESLQGVLSKPSAQALAFLQLASAQRLQLAVGTATLTWPGGSTFSNTITVNHGLSSNPVTVQALTQLPGGAAAVDVHYVSVSGTQVQFRGHTADGSSPLNTATTAFFWLAIG